jgi:hypothetical protein
MPTLATQASCKPKPLIQINPADSSAPAISPDSASTSKSTRSNQWPA